MSKINDEVLPTEPFYFGKNDSCWYFVPARLREVFDDWCNVPEPKTNATDAEWDKYEIEPKGVVRCSHPGMYTITGVEHGRTN